MDQLPPTTLLNKMETINTKNIKKNPKKVLDQSIKSGIEISKPTTDGEWGEMKSSWQEKYSGQNIKRFTSHCPVEVQERIRNMCFFTRIPISDYFVYALVTVLEQFEKDYNKGTPWGQRPQEVPQGRPLEN